jgi:predicted methyltransferase
MPRLTELAHAAVRTVLQPGEVAIDATAGNGHDTRFLAELVGPNGLVFALDIQPVALANTAALVRYLDNVTLLQRDHAEMCDAIAREHHGKVAAVMFNLGYLPGGEKAIVTQIDSTVRAITAAIELLRVGGVLSVLAYTGHTGGAEEASAIARLLGELSPANFEVQEYRGERDSVSPPHLFVVHKRLSAE